MDPAFEKSCKTIDRDLSPEWMDLSARVRQMAYELSTKAQNTALSEDAANLATEAGLLCNHIERLHGEVETLLAEMAEQMPMPEAADPTIDRKKEPEGQDIDQENIQIRSEQHELRADFRDILKALFLWKDDPVERARGKKSVL